MGVSRVYEAAMPYNGSELAELDFEQTADTMYLAHIDHAPGKLLRADHDDWSFAEVAFSPALAAPTGVAAVDTEPNTDAANGGNNYFPQPASYVVTAVNDDTGEESRASSAATVSNDLSLKRNYNTVTWGAVTDASRYNIYKADNNQFYGYIGTTEDLTFRDDNIGPALDKAPPAANNPFSGANDYPSTVTLYEQRSVWGRTRNAPNAIWLSRTGLLENMDRSRPARADDALSLSIVAGRVNSINQLVSTTSLLALTSDSIFNIDGDGSGGVIQANTNPAARRQIGRGGSRLGPLVVDNVVFYTPSVGQAVRTINYSFEIDGLKSNDVSIFSPHFFIGFEIVAWCYSQEPRSLIWAVRSDGKLLCFTWEQEQQVWGWTLCETDGLVKSICSISEEGEDRVYLIVEREVAGVTRRFVEHMVSHAWDDVEETCFMDCAVSGTFSKTKRNFTGLWHLNGRNDVVANIEGAFITGLTVSNGMIAITDEMVPDLAGDTMRVSFGIPYQVDVKTLPIRVNTQDMGSNLGRRQQVGETVLQLRNTASILAGIDEDHLYPVKDRYTFTPGQTTALMDGTTEPLSVANKAGTEIEVHIRQTLPGPFELLAVAVDSVFNQ